MQAFKFMALGACSVIAISAAFTLFFESTGGKKKRSRGKKSKKSKKKRSRRSLSRGRGKSQSRLDRSTLRDDFIV